MKNAKITIYSLISLIKNL